MDGVTQWPVVASVQTICEAHLLRVIEERLAQFPFEILGNDNGLAETKNGAVVRKEFGCEHIHRRHAAGFDAYCREYLNPFLNFHRPCLFAAEQADPKKPGRIKRVYRPRDAMTPLDKLASMPEAQSYLRPGVTLLQHLARALTDVQAAEELNAAHQALFRRVATRTG